MPKRTKRRDYGTHSVYQRCDTKRYGCPPTSEVTLPSGKTVRRRPDHKCRAIWVGVVQLGVEYVGNDENGAPKYKRATKTIYGKTQIEVQRKLRAIDPDTAVSQVPTVAQWLTRWLDEIIIHKVTPNTMAGYRWAVNRYLIPNIGRWPMDKLTPGHVQQLVEKLRRTPKTNGKGTLSRTSVQQIFACLSAAMEDAAPFDYLSPRGNPCSRIDAPGRGKTELGELDAEEAALLLKAVADHPYGSRWAFALLTALRRGECLGLRWEYVHLDDDIPYADVSWQLQRIRYRDRARKELDVDPDWEYERLDGGLVLCRPKSGSQRVVPLVPSLVTWLRRHREEQQQSPYDLVWCRDDGRPIDPRHDSDAWTDILTRHGLPPVRLHSARHTCVSLLYALGVQEVFIQQIAGHTTKEMTRRYRLADLGPASKALAQLDAHLNRRQIGELR